MGAHRKLVQMSNLRACFCRLRNKLLLSGNAGAAGTLLLLLRLLIWTSGDGAWHAAAVLGRGGQTQGTSLQLVRILELMQGPVGAAAEASAAFAAAFARLADEHQTLAHGPGTASA